MMISLLSLAACAESPKPEIVTDACVALQHFCPDPGFKMRWTRREMIALVKTNRYIEKNCGAAACAPR